MRGVQVGVPTEGSGVQEEPEAVREVVLSTEAAAVFVSAVAAAAAAAGEEAVEASEERAGTDFDRTPTRATSIFAK